MRVPALRLHPRLLAAGQARTPRGSRHRVARFVAVACVASAASVVALGSAEQAGRPLPLARGADPATGVHYYTLDDASYLGDGAPVSARALELGPAAATLDVEFGKDGAQGRATVEAMAARRGALAAVNAGFFGTTGDPAGIYKVNGLLVSDTGRPRGAVAFMTSAGAPLQFDRVTARARLRIGRTIVPVTGVDTVRASRAVVVYTPRYGSAPRSAVSGAPGTEWTLDGSPLTVTAISASTAAKPASPAAVPSAGFVISASGPLPPALARLKKGDRVDVAATYTAALGTPIADWRRADDIIGGAGLLLWRGRAVAQWKAESLPMAGFVESRHPRTVIGRDRDGDTWLVVVDGRQPGHSAGMTLAELTAFARRLGLVDALNLDGGGSTTMVVRGKIVNRPSDPLGSRPVSDAIVVLSR